MHDHWTNHSRPLQQALHTWCAVLAFALAAGAQERDPGPVDARDPAFERLPNGDLKLGQITMHRHARQLSFPARFTQDTAVLEVIIATPRGRLHEALLVADVSAVKLQAMLFLLGLHNGPRVLDAEGRQGDLVDIDVEWTDEAGKMHRDPVETWIRDTRTGAPMERIGWVFVGSGVRNGMFLADVGGNLVINYSIDDTVLDTPHPNSDDDTLHVVHEDQPSPGPEATVRVILTPRAPPGP